jgi:hypothetical protein
MAAMRNHTFKSGGRVAAAFILSAMILFAVLLACVVGCAMTPAQKDQAIAVETGQRDQVAAKYTAATQAVGTAEAAVKAATTQDAPALIAIAKQADAAAAATKKQLDAVNAALVKLQNAPTFDPNDPAFVKTVTAIAGVAAAAIPGAQPAIPFLPIVVPSLLTLGYAFFSNKQHAANAATSNSTTQLALGLVHKLTGAGPMTADETIAAADAAKPPIAVDINKEPAKPVTPAPVLTPGQNSST